MEKIKLNGKRYIALGDLDHLRYNLSKNIYDRCERGEDGKIHLSETDMAKIDAYSTLMSEVMAGELAAAESPDEIREMHDDLRREWMRDKYVIVANDNGNNVFFRKMCDAMNENKEDAEQPVFTSKIRLANTYSDHFNATVMARYLMQNWDIETKIEPLYLFAMTNSDAKKLLDAIFKDKDAEQAEQEGKFSYIGYNTAPAQGVL